jgi:hypothetical protein
MTQASQPAVEPATPEQAPQPRSVRAQLDRFFTSLPFPLPHIAVLYVALTIVTAVVVIAFGWGK